MSIVGTRPPLISETNLYEPHHKVTINGVFSSFFAAKTACPVPQGFVRPAGKVPGISLIS